MELAELLGGDAVNGLDHEHGHPCLHLPSDLLSAFELQLKKCFVLDDDDDRAHDLSSDVEPLHEVAPLSGKK